MMTKLGVDLVGFSGKKIYEISHFIEKKMSTNATQYWVPIKFNSLTYFFKTK